MAKFEQPSEERETPETRIDNLKQGLLDNINAELSSLSEDRLQNPTAHHEAVMRAAVANFFEIDYPSEEVRNAVFAFGKQEAARRAMTIKDAM